MHWFIFQLVIILKNGEDTAEEEDDDDCEEDEQGIEGLTLTSQTAQIWLVALNVYIWKMEEWEGDVRGSKHTKSHRRNTKNLSVGSSATTRWVLSMRWSDELV